MSAVDTISVASSPDTIRLQSVLQHVGRNSGVLQHPEKIERVVVVAFGAFERYYICWQDKALNYHQESHKLPPRLQAWLFPPSPSHPTRDFETLQVSFGSNDDFLAFDREGKISSRDILPQTQTQTAPHARNKSLPIVARDVTATKPETRRRSPSILSLPEASLLRFDPSIPSVGRLKRRSTVITVETARHTWPGKRLSLSMKIRPVIERIEAQTKEPEVDFVVANMTQSPVTMEKIEKRGGYVNASVQTEVIGAPGLVSVFGSMEMRPFSIAESEPELLVPVPPIGAMQEFCRAGCYQLGDALRHV